MSQPLPRKRLYFANLDGLRGLFFVLVFICHGCKYESPELQKHWINPIVQYGTAHNPSLVLAFFFVMSSFIITTLLLRERTYDGSVWIGGFYLRRVLRIWPLYAAALLIGFGLYPALRSLGSHPFVETGKLWHYLLFIQNFYFVPAQNPSFLGLAVMWSVAIEEQFYVIWPLLLAFVPLRRQWLVMLVVLAGALAWQINTPQDLYHTLTCTTDLAVGGLAALLVFYAQQYRWPLARRLFLAVRLMPRWLVAALWLSALYLYRNGLGAAPPAWQPLERLVVDVVAMLVLLEQNYGRYSLFKLGNVKGLRRLGQLAYGLYLLHAVALVVAEDLYIRLGRQQTVWDIVLVKPIFAFGLSLAMAWVSFRYFELPFLKLYSRFSRPRREAAQPPVAAELVKAS
jgi:peptidoglycan/LPS O-acetylase OafA/YrhL